MNPQLIKGCVNSWGGSWEVRVVCSVWSVIIFKILFLLLFTAKSPVGFTLSPLSWRLFLMPNVQFCQNWLNCSAKIQIFAQVIIVSMNSILGFPPLCALSSLFSLFSRLSAAYEVLLHEFHQRWYCGGVWVWSIDLFPHFPGLGVQARDEGAIYARKASELVETKLAESNVICLEWMQLPFTGSILLFTY